MTEVLTIKDDDIFAQTNIYNISNMLFFSYFIENTFNDGYSSCSDYIYLSIKTCNTEHGVFETIGNIISVAPGESKSFEVSTRNKYVCLSITGEPSSEIRITAIFKSFCTMTPTTVKSAQIILDTILLTTSKPLALTIADPSSFIINKSSESNPIPVEKASISGNSITLTFPSTFFSLSLIDGIHLISYKATGTNNIKDIHGYELLDFNNKPLEVATPYINYPLESIILSTKNVESNLYKISNFTSFTYNLELFSKVENASSTITLYGSTSR